MHRHPQPLGQQWLIVVIHFTSTDKDTDALQWFKAIQAGKFVCFILDFPGLEPLPGYALFGAYAVKWIGLFNKRMIAV